MERTALAMGELPFELRPYRPEDADAVYEAAIQSRETIQPWMGWLHDAYHLDETRAWVEACLHSWDQGSAHEYVIWDRRDETVAGSCGLNKIDGLHRIANLGYWVRQSYQGRGLATQATLALKELGLKTLGLNRLEIVVAFGNRASRRVAEKAGAFHEGDLRKRLRVGSRVFDAHMYSLT